MKRILVSFVAVSALLLATAAPAAALTQTFKDVTETFVEVNPCTGEPVTITVTYNAVFHISTDRTGGTHLTGTQTGTVDVVPLDPTAPTYSGRFTIWFGGNTGANGEGFWQTLSIRLDGSDGSVLRVNIVDQFHLSNGELHVQFTNLNCRG